ncbi:MAG TPA: YdcF family protein [Stellaceae bacterium]|nr:YdcF family protein [Stellaceae bacterium]
MSSARPQPAGSARSWRSLRRLSGLAAPLAVVALLWLGGLVWFASALPTEIADGDATTDAIVVLTGGSLRVQSGLALLAAGRAKKLFVSGVYHGTDVAALLRVSRQAPDKVACCIELGYAADNTLGNALETAAWMKAEGFRSLRLVTASYHMPRSMLEFSRAMPDMSIVANPVFPERVRQERWWTWPGTALLIVEEYNKFLFAVIRPFVTLDQPATGSPST